MSIRAYTFYHEIKYWTELNYSQEPSKPEESVDIDLNDPDTAKAAVKIRILVIFVPMYMDYQSLK